MTHSLSRRFPTTSAWFRRYSQHSHAQTPLNKRVNVDPRHKSDKSHSSHNSRLASKLELSRTNVERALIFGFVGWGMVVGLALKQNMSNGDYDSNTLSAKEFLSKFKAKSQPDLAKAIHLLRAALPDRGDGAITIKTVVTDKDVLKAYSATNYTAYIGSEDAKPHGVVVFPSTTEDVSMIVKIAHTCGLSVVSRGSGTGLEGHATSVTGDSICIDLSRMNKILSINEHDSDLVCQAGARWDDINDELEARGLNLFFPLDPAPGATFGGMLSTSCSGTNAVRYGTARGEWFINATVVLPSGEIIKTRRRAHKSSAGFDMTQLFIGAEGTLGVVTEVTIKLAPVSPTTVAVAQFPSAESACAAVDELLKSNYGMHIQCVEFADSRFMEALNHSLAPNASSAPSSSSQPYLVSDSLFVKLQGTPSMISEASNTARAILAKHGCNRVRFARNDEESKEIWGHRRGALLAILGYIDGSKVWTTDVCVPVSNLPRLVQQVKEDAAAAGIICPIVGHVGDGNFHAALIYRNQNEFKKVEELSKKVVERALELDGTCTGEHGVGVGKRRYLEKELGKGTVDLMRTIKRTIDPNDIMNPGKLYPPIK